MNSNGYIRISNESFIDLAPFGKDKYRHYYQRNMPIKYLIRLFAQSIILDAYFCRDFPSVGLKDRMKDIIESRINYFCHVDFPLSKSLEEIEKFCYDVVKAIGYLCDDLSLQNGRPTEDIARFQQEYRLFTEAVNQRVQDARALLINLRDAEEVSQDIILCCFKFIQAEHQRGKEWARLFFEYASLPSATLVSEYRAISSERNNIPGSSINTMEHKSERYIHFCFFPQGFLLSAFIKLALQFFHEYVSHLSAAIHPQQVQKLKEVPTELDEGWMLFTAFMFFRERSHDFLDSSRLHLQGELEQTLEHWATGLVHQYEAKGGYTERVQKGWNIARNFHRFLQYNRRFKSHANILYYRLSFDLITRYPLHKNWHLHFMDALDAYLRGWQEELSNIISECIESYNGNEFIHLEHVWMRIKIRLPRNTLSLTGG